MQYYNNYPQGYVPGYNPALNYGGAMPDNLAQMRQNAPWVQPMTQPMQGNPAHGIPTGAQTAQEQQMIWVQGREGAKAYMVAPGASVVLWDSEQNAIYIKSADANGMPSTRVLTYTEVTNGGSPGAAQQDSFVTRSEFERLNDRIDGLCRDIYGAQNKEVGNAE